MKERWIQMKKCEICPYYIENVEGEVLEIMTANNLQCSHECVALHDGGKGCKILFPNEAINHWHITFDPEAPKVDGNWFSSKKDAEKRIQEIADEWFGAGCEQDAKDFYYVEPVYNHEMIGKPGHCGYCGAKTQGSTSPPASFCPNGCYVHEYSGEDMR